MTEILAGGALTAALGIAGWLILLGNRVSVVESKQNTLEQWLLRVEEKLDRVIERL